jgi:transposase
MPTVSAIRGSANATREWAGRLKPTLRQVHVAGGKLFVDYSGRALEVVDGLTTAQIFVAVLGASNYTYGSLESQPLE